jgi:hypothetical protein
MLTYLPKCVCGRNSTEKRDKSTEYGRRGWLKRMAG